MQGSSGDREASSGNLTWEGPGWEVMTWLTRTLSWASKTCCHNHNGSFGGCLVQMVDFRLRDERTLLIPQLRSPKARQAGG